MMWGEERGEQWVLPDRECCGVVCFEVCSQVVFMVGGKAFQPVWTVTELRALNWGSLVVLKFEGGIGAS